MTQQKKQRPAWAKRLEQVRMLAGARPLTQFYAGLAETNTPDFPSYAAALTYHSEPWRRPALAYLEAIAVRYPEINFEWLALGRGEKHRRDEERARRAEQLEQGGLPYVLTLLIEILRAHRRLPVVVVERDALGRDPEDIAATLDPEDIAAALDLAAHAKELFRQVDEEAGRRAEGA